MIIITGMSPWIHSAPSNISLQCQGPTTASLCPSTGRRLPKPGESNTINRTDLWDTANCSCIHCWKRKEFSKDDSGAEACKKRKQKIQDIVHTLQVSRKVNYEWQTISGEGFGTTNLKCNQKGHSINEEAPQLLLQYVKGVLI